MPIYEYVCMKCENHFEELVGVSAPDPACPSCGGERVSKQFSVFATHGGGGEQPSFSGPSGAGRMGGCCGGSCGC